MADLNIKIDLEDATGGGQGGGSGAPGGQQGGSGGQGGGSPQASGTDSANDKLMKQLADKVMNSSGGKGGNLQGMLGGGKGAEAGAEGAAEGAEGGAMAAGAEGAAAGAASGGILLVAEVVSQKIVDTLKTFQKVVQFVGELGQDIAGNQYGEAFKKLGGGMADLLDKIPVVGKAFGEMVRTVMVVVDTFNKVVDSFIKRGEELAAYSGDITNARATAQVRSLMADIREANAIGKGLADITDAQNRMEVAFRDLMLPIKEWIVTKLAIVIEYIAKKVEEISAYFVGADAKNAQKAAEKLFEDWWDGLRNPPMPGDNGGGKQAVEQAAQQGLAIPLFDGL